MANYANCRCYRMLPWGPLWYHHCDGYLGCPSPGIFFHTMALLRHALTGFSIWKNTPKHFMICTIYAPYISIYHLMNPVWYILCSFHVTSIAKSGVLSTPCIPCAPHNSSLLERLDLGVYITTSWDRCVSLPRLCQLATVAKNQMSTREGDSVCGFDVGLMLVFGSPAHSTCCLLSTKRSASVRPFLCFFCLNLHPSKEKNWHLLLTDHGRTSSSCRGCFDTEADGWPWGFSPVQPESGGKPCPSMCLAKHRSANMEGKKKILAPAPF